MKADPLFPHPRLLQLAGVLAIVGLMTAVVYTLRFTPYTMVLFMMVGQGLIVLSAGLFGYAALSGIKARLRSIVEKRFKAGDVIFRQGDYADRLYVIGKGEVEVIRESPGEADVVLTRLGKDQFFGEIGILANAPRTATVRAATDVEVLSIHRNYFSSLFTYLPVFRERILSVYETRTAADHRG
jgi:CRP/FNR family transcriptional regulator, cyclic AMP receptor protein